MKIVKVIVLCFIAISLFGCNGPGNKEKVNNTQIVEPVNYGNGVYYFYAAEATFGNSLSKFIAKNPTLEVVAMTGNGTASHGHDDGYFVVFKTLPASLSLEE